MLYDLIEVEPKINKKKVIITCIIVAIILLLIVILFFMHFKYNGKNTDNNNEISITNTEEIKKMQQNVKINMLPNYTENTISQIKDIYKQPEKSVYLTFDDGPSKSVTPLILDLLKQESIKASFFVLGSRAEVNHELIKREYEEGHFIANHGYSHEYRNIYETPQAVLDEYNRTRDIISNILGNGYDGHLFRFPGGTSGGKYAKIKAEAVTLLEQNQIAHIDWNALSSDSAGAKTKEQLIENIKETVGTKNTVVILMHDASDKILTYETLPDVINYLREQGYNFKNFYSIMK